MGDELHFYVWKTKFDNNTDLTNTSAVPYGTDHYPAGTRIAWNPTATSTQVAGSHHKTELTVNATDGELEADDGLFIAVRKKTHNATENVYLQFHIEGYY